MNGDPRTQDHVYDRFEGSEVVVQFTGVYYLITYPGVPYTMPKYIDMTRPIDLSKPSPEGNWEPTMVRVPSLMGNCHIEKDSRGNVSIVITRSDPNPERNNLVVASFSPDQISSISMAEEESRIIAEDS